MDLSTLEKITIHMKLLFDTMRILKRCVYRTEDRNVQKGFAYAIRAQQLAPHPALLNKPDSSNIKDKVHKEHMVHKNQSSQRDRSDQEQEEDSLESLLPLP